MSNSIFRFKQFEVDQHNCAMKINTDGVLLGAIANHPGPESILDIGTGTGVIALMLAQRFRLAAVDAVEIEPHAAATAGKNFGNSPFSDRLTIYSTSFEKFDAEKSYDLIVSNPPFFVNDLKSASQNKEMARHTDTDFFDHLLERSASLLNSNGLLWLILPPLQAELMINNAPQYGLSLCETIAISSFKNKAVFRLVICLSNTVMPLNTSTFSVYDAPGVHSNQYNTLLQDFFLAL